MGITQRQATLGILAVHMIGASLFCLGGVLRNDDMLLTVASGVDALFTAGLMIATQRGWDGARYIEITVTTLLIGLLIPDPANSPQMDTAMYIAPVLALILGGTWWVLGSAGVLLGMQYIRTGGQGIYADPQSLIVYGVSIGGMVVARMVMTTAQRAAEKNAVNAEDRARVKDQHNVELTILNQFSARLHTCHSLEEVAEVTIAAVAKLFPGSSSALYLQAHEQQEAVMVGQSGGDLSPQPPVDIDRCTQLQQEAQAPEQPRHQQDEQQPQPPVICESLVLQGGQRGLLRIRLPGQHISERQRQLAVSVADQSAWALANLFLRDQLQQQAIRDPLTGLFNRRYMEESLARELHRAERLHTALGVMMLDLDHFKRINDSFGHAAGDFLLQEIAKMISARRRGSDIVCRYGGEELVLILPEASLEFTQQQAEQLREAVQQLQLTHDGKQLHAVTVSIGVAAFPDSGVTMSELLHAADTALYAAKAHGRNCVSVAPQHTYE